MAEYIDLNEIAESMKENIEVISKAVLKAKQMVTEDLVIVIRCKDCKFYKQGNKKYGFCNFWEQSGFHINGIKLFPHVTGIDDFCSCGERREIDE